MNDLPVTSPSPLSELVKADPSSAPAAIRPGDSRRHKTHTVRLLCSLAYTQRRKAEHTRTHTDVQAHKDSHTKMWLSGVIMSHGDWVDETSAVSSTDSR